MPAIPSRPSIDRASRRVVVGILLAIGLGAATTTPVGAQASTVGAVPSATPPVAARAGGGATSTVPIDADLDGDDVADALEATVAEQSGETVEVIVRLEPGADPTAVATAAGDAAAVPLDLIDAVALRVPSDDVATLSDLPGVAFVAEDVVVEASNQDGGTALGVPAARSQAGVDGDRDGNPGAYTAGDVVVAVLDTGVDVTHVDLDGGKVLAWYDPVGGRSSPYDDHGHGSHVAATIAGTGEGNAALAGMAPRAGLVGVKVLGSDGTGRMSQVVQGLDWVVANRGWLGVEIINLSLGFPGCSNGTDDLSNAVNTATALGLVVIAASGNRGPARCTVGSPAAAAGAIAVGAVQVNAGGTSLVGAAYASRGPTADGRNGIDVVAPGNLTSVDGRPLYPAPTSRSGYMTRTGTSMAAASVSGVVALLLDRNPGMSPAQVRDVLRSTATDWGAPGLDPDHGAGFVNAWAALGSAGTPPARPAHGRLQGYVPQGGRLAVPVLVGAGLPLGVTVVHGYDGASSTANDLDVAVRTPGGLSTLGSANSSGRVETLTVTPSQTGFHEIAVSAAAGGSWFALDVDGAVAVPAAPPAAPTVTAVGGPDRITVSWSPGAGDPIAYTISSEQGPLVTVDAGQRSMTFAGLPEGTSRTFRVQALNLAGASAEGVATAGVSRFRPFPTPEAFVAQQYRDFLLREADPGGLAYWSGQLRAGMTGTSLVGSFLNSAEYEGRIASLARLYFAYFLRAPDVGGLQFWLEQRAAGRPLTWVSGFFSESPEFQARYGSLDDVAFVRLVYANVLGRGPDFAGLLFWLDELRSGRMGRGRVMLEFSESAEFRRTSRGEVDTTLAWFGLLRQIPTPGDYAYWVPTIEGGTDRLVLVDALLRDPRYAARFGL